MLLTYPCACCWGVLAGSRGSGLHAVLGGASCAGIILLLFVASSGRGIGFGDLKLAGCIGLGLGPEYGVIALGLASSSLAVHTDCSCS